MKPCLADVNLLLPLLVRHHVHHQLALNWFDNLRPGEACLCRFVQLALIRLLGNRTLMGPHAVSAEVAWAMLEQLLDDERVNFIAEPADVSTCLAPLLKYPVATGKLVADAYLAAFAIAGKMRLVTLDQGFRQFRGLDLLLLAA